MIRDFHYDHNDASLQARCGSRPAKASRPLQRLSMDFVAGDPGRVLGYPTRVTYGANPFPKSYPSHCKLEVFPARRTGRVSFDVSETQNPDDRYRSMMAETGRVDNSPRPWPRASGRLKHGFRDNTWFLQTRGHRLRPESRQQPERWPWYERSMPRN